MSANVQGLSRVSLISPSALARLSTDWVGFTGHVSTSRALLWSQGPQEEVRTPPSNEAAYSPGVNLTLLTPSVPAYSYALQIRNIIEAGYRSIGEVPVIIGETGVPFDLNGGSAFRTGDFKWQERQMDAICSALEENLVGYK